VKSAGQREQKKKDDPKRFERQRCQESPSRQATDGNGRQDNSRSSGRGGVFIATGGFRAICHCLAERLSRSLFFAEREDGTILNPQDAEQRLQPGGWM
jgi:hypothetical protein